MYLKVLFQLSDLNESDWDGRDDLKLRPCFHHIYTLPPNPPPSFCLRHPFFFLQVKQNRPPPQHIEHGAFVARKAGEKTREFLMGSFDAEAARAARRGGGGLA